MRPGHGNLIITQRGVESIREPSEQSKRHSIYKRYLRHKSIKTNVGKN